VGRDSARSRGQLASLAADAGRIDEGAAQFERSTALLPTPEVYAAFIGMLAIHGRFEEAASHCDELLAIAPGDANAHRLVAAVYARMGRVSEATALRDRAQTLDRRTPPAEAPRAQRPAVY
jgi:Flp pilus assembly protein TadD